LAAEAEGTLDFSKLNKQLDSTEQVSSDPIYDPQQVPFRQAESVDQPPDTGDISNKDGDQVRPLLWSWAEAVAWWLAHSASVQVTPGNFR